MSFGLVPRASGWRGKTGFVSYGQNWVNMNKKLKSCQEIVRKKKQLRSFYTEQVVVDKWRTQKELNLQPSDP